MYFKLRTKGFKGAVCCKALWEEGCRDRAQGDECLPGMDTSLSSVPMRRRMVAQTCSFS